MTLVAMWTEPTSVTPYLEDLDECGPLQGVDRMLVTLRRRPEERDRAAEEQKFPRRTADVCRYASGALLRGREALSTTPPTIIVEVVEIWELGPTN